MGDRERWDGKYHGGLGREVLAPDGFVVAVLESLGPGGGRPALDLAAGTGRHALELARRGWRVEAWDVSPIGLGILTARAVARGAPTVETRAVDLLDPDLALEERFDLVCVVDFLDRMLWGRLHELVRPCGHLIARTFTTDWPGPRPPALYRLAPGELAGGIPGFETARSEEAGGRAGLLAVRR